MSFLSNLKSLGSWSVIVAVLSGITAYSFIRFLYAIIESILPGFSDIQLYGIITLSGFVLLAFLGLSLRKLFK